MEIPDDLYRLVKAKSALEGRAVREVALELFAGYVQEEPAGTGATPVEEPRLIDGEPAPAWFGVLRASSTRKVADHGLEAIRESIAKGIAAEAHRYRPK